MFIFALVWKCTDSCTRHRQTPRLSTAVQEASRTATTPCHLVGISDLGAQQQQSMDDLTFSRKIGLCIFQDTRNHQQSSVISEPKITKEVSRTCLHTWGWCTLAEFCCSQFSRLKFLVMLLLLKQLCVQHMQCIGS